MFSHLIIIYTVAFVIPVSICKLQVTPHTKTSNLDSESRFHDKFTERNRQLMSQNTKDFKICSVSSGLDVTRSRSTYARFMFKDAIDDVEFMREYVTEALFNGGISEGFSDLDELSQTLDWAARDLPNNYTTNMAGLGWTDDRIDRRIDRCVVEVNEPFVGTKQSDMEMIDSASNILPWIVDRKSKKSFWHLSHQNGHSEGASKKQMVSNSLYFAAWIGTYGEAWVYYPPLKAYYGHPSTICDGGIATHDSHEDAYIYPALPAQNPEKKALFTDPYPDVAYFGQSMISAIAPVYYTGSWKNYTFNDTFIATAGIDISLQSMSANFDELEDQLTAGSFALLADATTFNVIAISQSIVNKIYPERTGFEESRVVTTIDGDLVEDRRNQTYLVSDTIHQNLSNLTNANWTDLLSSVQRTPAGQKDYSILNITLTGDSAPTSFYVFYDRWAYVSNWVLLVFAPIQEVVNAINCTFLSPSVSLQTEKGTEVGAKTVLINSGTLDVTVMTNTLPEWINLITPIEGRQILRTGENLTIDFLAQTDGLETGMSSSNILLDIEDHEYPDCFLEQTISFQIEVKVLPQEQLNQITKLRPIGLTLAAIVIFTSLFFILWVMRFRKVRIVKASQPMFLIMLCFGTLVMGCAIIPLSIDDSIASDRGCDIACMATPWLFTMGFTIIFSALFSKIWRINKIFHNPQFQRIKVKERDVLIPFAVLLTLNFVFLLAWTFVDPLYWDRLPVGDIDNRNSYGICHADTNASTVFFVLIVAVNLSALILACFQAYQARSIDDEFSESKYVCFAMICMLQELIIALPLIFLTRTNPSANFFAQSGSLFLICMSLLLLIFVPKQFHLRKHLKEKAKKAKNKRNNSSIDQTSDESRMSASGLKLINRPIINQPKETDYSHGVTNKIKELAEILEEQGVDSDSVLKKVGLDQETQQNND